MIISTQKQLDAYKNAAKLSMEILTELVGMVAPGVYPIEIDRHAEKLCKKNNVRAAFRGQKDLYSTYSYSTCISTNDVVVHGVPSSESVIKDGDIVSVDFGLVKDGLYTDHCHTIGVGEVSESDKKLINSARSSIQSGVAECVEGNRVGDIGYAISSVVSSDGFVIAKEFIGHSIGTRLWEDPGIPPIGKKGTGPRLTEGLVLCVEAQILAGSDKVYRAEDGWTIKTKDGKNAAMFEYMVVVQKDVPLILTDSLNWKITV